MLEEERQLRIHEQEYEADEEGETASYSEDESAFLSLSEKPDRNMALLDDYEMEELDYPSDPNHRSGLSLLPPVVGCFSLFLTLL